MLNAKRAFAATGNPSFGYWGGGYAGSTLQASIDRLDYSNDTTTTTYNGSLSINRVHHSAVGNASFGYFAGGEVPSVVTSVDRLDLSNDTANASPKGNISVGRVQFKGASSQQENGLSPVLSPYQPPFSTPAPLPPP